MDTDKVIILREAELHPHSMLEKIEAAFEKPSIAHIVTKDGLRSYTKRPIFDLKYLVLFESVKLFESNLAYLKLDIMMPVVLCTTKSATEDAKSLCQDKGIAYALYNNPFEKEDAYDLIRELATEHVTDSFCKALVRRVGLSPQRIVSAITVCDQVGYKEININRYIDKHIYIDIYDVIESLLGICRSMAQRKRAALYVHMNRLWYTSYTRGVLVKEVAMLIQIYRDFLEGNVTSFSVQDYAEAKHVSRYRILYTRNLLESVSINDLLALKYFLETASILEVTMRLT